jgi:hypothetical protein
LVYLFFLFRSIFEKSQPKIFMKIFKKILLITLTVFFLLVLYIAIKGNFNMGKMQVQTMILGGRIVAPEAAQILDHYTSGNGDTLWLDSSYLQRSPVVIKHAKPLKTGELRKVGMHQHEDWRLSYALNGFTLERTKKGYRIYQHINFDTTGTVPTYLNLGFTKIKVMDAVAHSYKCTPFWAICEFHHLVQK